MTTFRTYMLKKAYENVKKHGYRLAWVDSHIDWVAFRPIITSIYPNKTSKKDRHNVDPVVMVKLLVLLHQW